jgi:serine/threonine-protein kinase
MNPGTKVGPYEILAAIGAGGMGEVYPARDTKLGRDVAIKVLPEAFVREADRMARFQREAKVLASLDHPNIASIYGLEDSDGTQALVMQLVEGPTLADRIKAGPIPVDEAVRIAKQIADALEYAHERGIIHRDLKPANVKVTNDDAVKVLDFGLAKALEGDPSSFDISTSPTISRMATMQGVLLGTAAYMSPEQAKAKPVDRRTDIWAFGCVLYETLAGKMAFSGETVTDTLAAVIRAEPDWSQLPAETPTRVRVLLQRCLQKDVRQRLQAMGDARISLEEVLSGAPEGTRSPGVGPPAKQWRLWLASGIAAVVIVAAAASLVTWNLKPLPPKPVMRFTITLPPGQHLAGLDRPALALSPDGSLLAYVAAAQGGATQQIYVRAMDSGETRPIPGTEDAVSPFFSPDGEWLGFFSDERLRKISVRGGAPQALSEVRFPVGASWGTQGTIVFASRGSVLHQISDAGGAPQPLSRFEKGEVSHVWPDFLPGGKAVLFTAILGSGTDVQTLGKGERRDLIHGGTSPRYARSGHLVYAQGATLMAMPFDPERLEAKGAAVPVVQGVQSSVLGGAAQYSLSATGSLVYVSGSSQALQSKLVWVSRNGTEQPLPAPPRSYAYLQLSPDGRRVAIVSESQIWLYDFARDTLSRFTFEGSNNLPVWTPDGKRIAFMSNRGGPYNIFWQMADGSGGLERLTTDEHNNVPRSFSPDGQLLAFHVDSSTGSDIWVLRLRDRKVQPFLQTPASESAPQFSPDGRWLAYVSDESGRYEVYVQPYPGPGGKYLISTEGGREPLWNNNGRELFYRSGDKVMAVDVMTQPNFSAGKPKELFEGRYLQLGGTVPQFAFSPDGQRFLMLKPVEQEAAVPTQINVVLNWTEELKRLVPTGNK